MSEKGKGDPWQYCESKIINVCTVRNGERCKDCVFYGKACNKFKSMHRGLKPLDYDPYKHREQSTYFNREKNRWPESR